MVAFECQFTNYEFTLCVKNVYMLNKKLMGSTILDTLFFRRYIIKSVYIIKIRYRMLKPMIFRRSPNFKVVCPAADESCTKSQNVCSTDFSSSPLEQRVIRESVCDRRLRCSFETMSERLIYSYSPRWIVDSGHIYIYIHISNTDFV